MNQNARDKLIHYSLRKGKDFPSHLENINNHRNNYIYREQHNETSHDAGTLH